MKRIAVRVCLATACIFSSIPMLAQATDSAMLAEGKELFQSKATPACAVCHTLQDAEATGTIGPDLDELKADRERIKNAMIEGTGVMPSFADTLSEEQREAVAAYVAHATGAED